MYYLKSHNTSTLGIVCILSLFLLIAGCSRSDRYDRTLRREGREPAAFIENKLQHHDLIIVDDALHPAVEPYEFICDYLREYPKSVDYIFLEVVPITAQAAIDSFMNADSPDTMILASVFQQDFRYGWANQTYLDLMFTVWDLNRDLPGSEKIRIMGVDQPIYWEGLHTREDYNLFQESLIARDYFMYKTILGRMNGFHSGKKALFLTNTRHAYKCIRNKAGEIYWNAGTFFHEWHPGKSYAVRFHNMILHITELKENVENASMEGMDRFEYTWTRLDGGAWDAAFARNGNTPVAIPLKGNIFGKHPYYGNHMADALDGQTMYDAYDALIFIKPLEETRFSAQMNFFYTEDFKKELEHRVRVIEGHRLEEFLNEHKVKSVRDYVETLCRYEPESMNPTVNSDQ